MQIGILLWVIVLIVLLLGWQVFFCLMAFSFLMGILAFFDERKRIRSSKENNIEEDN